MKHWIGDKFSLGQFSQGKKYVKCVGLTWMMMTFDTKIIRRKYNGLSLSSRKFQSLLSEPSSREEICTVIAMCFPLNFKKCTIGYYRASFNLKGTSAKNTRF